MIKGPVGLFILALLAGWVWFAYHSQVWHSFEPKYAANYQFNNRNVGGGAELPASSEAGNKTCAPSAIVQVTADLIDYNVNQNAWIPSMLMSKLGLFGIEWKLTPWFDNKAAFQRGVNQGVRRVSAELIDRLGRVRGTSQLDQDLQRAREAVFYPEDLWYLSGIRPVQPTPSRYREAIPALRSFNERLSGCNATFDPRADNLVTFLDRITFDIWSTSDILRERAEASNAGWFDVRADDRFWFAYGQLYAYAGIMRATRADFNDVVKSRGLTALWDRIEVQFDQALSIIPAIISNGAEDGWIMPTHLATTGFYVLRVRTNMVEIREVLDR